MASSSNVEGPGTQLDKYGLGQDLLSLNMMFVFSWVKTLWHVNFFPINRTNVYTDNTNSKTVQRAFPALLLPKVYQPKGDLLQS